MASEWIEWTGGEQPVSDDTYVQYRTVDGKEDLGPIGKLAGYPAEQLRWNWLSSISDITDYRVVQP